MFFLVVASVEQSFTHGTCGGCCCPEPAAGAPDCDPLSPGKFKLGNAIAGDCADADTQDAPTRATAAVNARRVVLATGSRRAIIFRSPLLIAFRRRLSWSVPTRSAWRVVRDSAGVAPCGKPSARRTFHRLYRWGHKRSRNVGERLTMHITKRARPAE